ncbi:MAG: repeat protein [Ignavibacteria bacterium]|nr:repeat protein [Ignavibacteria bacterium]
MKIIFFLILLMPIIVLSKEPFWCQGGHKSWISNPINKSEITPDNKYFITAGKDATIKIFDIASGNMVNSLDNGFEGDSKDQNLRKPCYNFAISNDSKNLITDNGLVYLIPEGKLISRYSKTNLVYGQLLIDNNSNDQVIDIRPNFIRYVDFLNNNLKKEIKFENPDSNYYETLINSDKTKLIIYSANNGIFSVIDMKTGKTLIKKNIYPPNTYLDFDINNNTNTIYAKIWTSNEVLVIDINTLNVIKTFNAISNHSDGLFISPDGKYLFMDEFVNIKNGAGYRLCRYEIDNLSKYSPMDLFNITDLKFLTNSNKALAIEYDGSYANLIDYETLQIENNIISHSKPLDYITFSPDDKYFISIERDISSTYYHYQFFDVDNKIRKNNAYFPRQNNIQNSNYLYKPFIEFSSDNNYFITAGPANDQKSKLNSIYLYKISDSSVVREFRGHSLVITKAIFSADGKNIVSVSVDSTIRVWDINTGKEVDQIKLNKILLNLIESYDGQYYYVVNYRDYDHQSFLSKINKKTKIINDFDQKIWILGKENNFLSSFNTSFSKDRKYFVYPFWESVNIVDLTADTIYRHIPFKYPRYCALSKDNKYIVLAGDSAKIEVWDVEKNKKLSSDYSYPYDIYFNNARIYDFCPPSNISSCFANQRNLFAVGTDDASSIIWDYSDLTAVDDEPEPTEQLRNKDVYLKRNIINDNKLTIIFNLKQEDNVRIELFDYMGNVVDRINNAFLTGSNVQYDIELNNLSAGQYFCKVSFNGTTEILKFIIID